MFLKSCTLFPRHAPGLGIVQEAIEQAALTHSSTMHCVKSRGFLGNSPNMVVYLYGPSQAEGRPSAAATEAAAPAAAASGGAAPGAAAEGSAVRCPVLN